jgi:hypothetical protein
MDPITRNIAHKVRAANPDDPPQYLGPRRPGAVEACLVDGMHVISYKVHRETGFHKRAMARQRRQERAARGLLT